MNNTAIDINYIKEWVNISNNELDKMLQNIVELQKTAESIERDIKIQQRMQDKGYDVDFIKTFLVSYPYLSGYFSPEEILYACKLHFDKDILVQEKIIRGCLSPKCIRTGKFVKYTMADFPVNTNNFRSPRIERDTATVLLVPNDSQFFHGVSDMIQYLLMKRFPFLKDYEIHFCDPRLKIDWIFIKNPDMTGVTDQSLYVPMSALLEKDVKRIVQSHYAYWHGYTDGKMDTEIIRFLESDFVQKFLQNVR